MRKIISIIKKDFALSLRDNIVIYIIIAPLLLALAIRMFLPSVDEIKLSFVMEESIPSSYMEEIQKFGDVEVLPTTDAVIERVGQSDAIPGIILRDNVVKVIFEGNEPQSILNSYTPILESIFNENPQLNITTRQVGENQPILYGVMTIIIVMTAIFLGGTVSGFNIISEKDTNVIRSMAVSPLKMRDFVIARGIIATSISVVIGLLSSLILVGFAVDFSKVLLLLLASSSMAVIISLLIGRIANNQINSIAAIKVVMPVFITLPLASLFIPKVWHLVLYPLPNYWAFIGLQHIFLSEGSTSWFYISIAMLFLISNIYLVAISKIMKKHFGLR